MRARGREWKPRLTLSCGERQLRGLGQFAPFLGLLAILAISCAGVEKCIFQPATIRVQSLPVGEVGVFYEGILRAGIKNDPDDDHFEYEFSIEHGRLPEGLTAHADGRNLIISGIPTEAGLFQLEVRVEATEEERFFDEEDEGVDLCESRFATKDIEIQIRDTHEL